MTKEEAKREILFAKRQVMADSYIDKAYDMAIKALEQPAQQWISVKERMPEERDSIFKERYGTDRWRNTMFLKTSDNVLATVVDNNGNYTVVPACTIDGRWSIWKNLHCKVVAWQQYPEPYKEE